jgi:hypothetical protein
MGFDCIQNGSSLVGRSRHKRENSCSREPHLKRGLKVIGSSEQVHMVDALAITGDEGRSSLRKAAGSRQTGFDPQMSEWGNPARKGHLQLNT